MGANLTRTIMLSVVIVRVGGRSSKHRRSDFAWPARAGITGCPAWSGAWQPRDWRSWL